MLLPLDIDSSYLRLTVRKNVVCSKSEIPSKEILKVLKFVKDTKCQVDGKTQQTTGRSERQCAI